MCILECLLGMQCDDFTIIAADQTEPLMIFIMKNDEDKIIQFSDTIIGGITGSSGDKSQFSQFISKNMQLYKMKNKYELDPTAVINFMRRTVTESLTRDLNVKAPAMLNMLLGSYDMNEGPQLHTMDHLGSCVKVPYGTHGLGGLLTLSTLGSRYRPDLTVYEAYELMVICVYEIHRRLLINLPSFTVKTMSKEGVITLPPIKVSYVATESSSSIN